MAFKIPKTVDAVTGLLSFAALSAASLALVSILIAFTKPAHNVATDRLWIFPVMSMVFGVVALWSHKTYQKRHPQR